MSKDLELLENELNEAQEENEAKTQRNLPIRIDYRATKESAQKLGITMPKRWQFTLYLWKDAGAIKRFQEWMGHLDVFFKDRNEKAIYAQAVWLGVQSLVQDTKKYIEYQTYYKDKEYDKIPNDIKQMFDDQLQENHKRLLNERLERRDTNWLLYKDLGKTAFIEMYQHIENFPEILSYCEDMESSQSADATLTKTQRIQHRLAELAQTNDSLPLAEIKNDMFERGIIDSKNDDSTLKYQGNILGLSSNKTHGVPHGHWDLTKLKAA